MPKVDLDLIAEVLKSNEVDPQVANKIMQQIEEEIKREAEMNEATREPPVKKQFVMILSDPRNEVPVDDLVGWVVQIPEMDSPMSAIDRIKKSAYEFNISKKGSKYPVNSIGEACEAVSAKFFKEQYIAIKTKLPVTVVKTDNILPKEKISMDDLRS
jgi:hypothetical protein